MNTTKTILISALLWLSTLPLLAQVLTNTNRTISKDTTVATISRNAALNTKAVITSGQVVFTSKSGYVRVLLTDDYGYDLLIYESTYYLHIQEGNGKIRKEQIVIKQK